MNGSLALVGSGEYLPAMASFEKSLIDDGIKNGKRPIYVQIPTAAGQESDDRLEYWKQLGKTQADRLGVDSIFLPIFTRDDANNPQYATLIHNAALIYMSGGDPHYLAETLMGTPLWDAIQENWRTGTSLAGCSAGAMVLSSHIPNFRLLKKLPTAKHPHQVLTCFQRSALFRTLISSLDGFRRVLPRYYSMFLMTQYLLALMS